MDLDDSDDSQDSLPMSSPLRAEVPDRSFRDNRSLENGPTKAFVTMPKSDRSLVIKINALKGSVTTVSAPNKIENSHRRDSEENNNGQASTSEERHWNNLDKSSEKEDSDNEELTVIDDGEVSSDDNKMNDLDDGKEIDDDEEKDKMEEDAEIKGNDVDAEGKEDNLLGEENKSLEVGDQIPLAGDDVPMLDLTVDGVLEAMDVQELLRLCIGIASPFCVYCNHARHIAIDGKQLALHMLANHRFQPQHPAIIIDASQFVAKLKKCLPELESTHFNLDSYDTKNGTFNVSSKRLYECFHCRFVSAVHKELYLHNRKCHQKTIILCVMCKSTFFNYSELYCHLCPGSYAANTDIR